MTERVIDPATAAQFTANGGWPVFLLDIFLDDAPLHIGSGFIGQVVDLSGDDPVVYTGLGEMGKFTIGAETMGGLASGVRYSLSGIDPSENTEITGFRAALGESLQTRIQKRRVRLRAATLGPSLQIVGTPVVMRDDQGDSLQLIDGGQTLELQLTAEMPSVDFKRIRRSTNSSVDHKRLHPGSPPDTFFDDDRWRRTDVRWGQKKTDGDPTDGDSIL